MNQKKIGLFLKELRKERGITQEQLAEVIGVSGRTVSRWETGFNMPDLDILIKLADYYNVEIREILDGERKSENLNDELEETVMKVADYSNQEKQGMARKVFYFLVAGIITITIHIIIEFIGFDEGFPGGFLAGISLGISYSSMLLGALYTSGYLVKLRIFKKKLLEHEQN